MPEILTVAAVGDLMLGDCPVRLGQGVRSRIEAVGADDLFAEIHPLIENADLLFGNLEAVLSDVGLDRGRLNAMEHRGSPESSAVLGKFGFNALCFSNNHCMQYGAAAFLETCRLLEKQGIFVSGIRSDTGGCIPYETTHHGIKVVLLAYSLCRENYCTEDHLPYTLCREESILEAVQAYRAHADILIVSLHWGEEYMDHPSPHQVAFAHRLAHNGVDLILGHHPHVLQGIERYQRSVIVYSLGNFISDMHQENTRQSMIFTVRCTKEGVSDFNLTPVYINDSFQPRPLNHQQYEAFLRNMDRLHTMIMKKYATIDALSGADRDHLQAEYLRMAHQKTLRHRFEDYFYFLTHIYQYPPRMIAQSLNRSVSRRLSEIRDWAKRRL